MRSRAKIKRLRAGRVWCKKRAAGMRDAGSSASLRSKEDAHDYRYFPDPDLLPVQIDRVRLSELAAQLPERPFDKQRRYQKEYSLAYTLTSVLCPNRSLADYFEAALRHHPSPKALANYICNDLLRELAAGCRAGPVDAGRPHQPHQSPAVG